MLIYDGFSRAFSSANAALGAWLILPFAGLELVVLAAAFYLNGRHAGDYEHIALRNGRLVVDVRTGGRLARHEFGAGLVRLSERIRGPEYRVILRSGERELEVGRHWDAGRRRRLAGQLREGLAGG